jgi:hypothetical protein
LALGMQRRLRERSAADEEDHNRSEKTTSTSSPQEAILAPGMQRLRQELSVSFVVAVIATLVIVRGLGRPIRIHDVPDDVGGFDRDLLRAGGAPGTGSAGGAGQGHVHPKPGYGHHQPAGGAMESVAPCGHAFHHVACIDHCIPLSPVCPVHRAQG